MRLNDGFFVAEIIPLDNIGISMNTAQTIQRIKTKALIRKAGDLLDKRLGHANQKVMIGMLKDARCMTGKTTIEIKKRYRTCFKSEHTRSTAKGNLIERSDNITVHVDSCGPTPVKSVGRNLYFPAMTTVEHRFMG